MAEKQDAELIEIFRNGNVEGYNQLVRRYQEKVYWIARRTLGNHEDADDVTQEVFIKMYQGLNSFRGESNLFTWLYRITVNVSLNNIRKRKVKQLVPFDKIIDQILPGTAQADENVLKQEYHTILEKAIEQLPMKQKAVFIMRYHDELPFEEIAKILRKTVGGTKANYFHAVRNISGFIKKEYR
jgi:RNA polymerase sigma-70 factor (ECF subfamily)